MSEFKFNIEKRTPLKKEHFIELGWEDLTENFPDMIENLHLFKKNNHWILLHLGNNAYPETFIKCYPIDPSKIEWTPWPENAKSMIKCPTKEIFEIIQNLI